MIWHSHSLSLVSDKILYFHQGGKESPPPVFFFLFIFHRLLSPHPSKIAKFPQWLGMDIFWYHTLFLFNGLEVNMFLLSFFEMLCKRS